MRGLMVILWNNVLLFMDVMWYYILPPNPKLGAILGLVWPRMSLTSTLQPAIWWPELLAHWADWFMMVQFL